MEPEGITQQSDQAVYVINSQEDSSEPKQKGARRMASPPGSPQHRMTRSSAAAHATPVHTTTMADIDSCKDIGEAKSILAEMRRALAEKDKAVADLGTLPLLVFKLELALQTRS